MMSKCGDPTCTDEKQQLVHWAKLVFFNSNGCYVLLEYYPIKWMQIADVHRFSPGQLLVSNMPVISPPARSRVFYVPTSTTLMEAGVVSDRAKPIARWPPDLHHDGLLFIGWGSKTYQDDGTVKIPYWMVMVTFS